jgi:ribonuclease P protein component
MKTVGRLLKRADFLRVHKTGKKWAAAGVVLQAAGAGGDAIRFGVTVSKKLDKTAVGRNRMRRRLKAAGYDILSIHAKTGADYVLIGRHETPARAYDALCEDIRTCLRKTGYMKE